MHLERVTVEGDNRRADRGQIFAFILALVFLAASLWLAFSGFQAVAGVIGGTTIVSLAVAFITGATKQSKERIEKDKNRVDARERNARR